MAKIHKTRSSKSRKQRQASPYSTFARNQSSPDTIRCYEYQLRRFEKFIVDRDATKIEDVTTADLLAYRETLEARGLKPSTVKRYLAAIRSLFRWALETGVIDHDPAAGLRLPRVLRNRTPDYLTSEETMALIQSIGRIGQYARRDRVFLWILSFGLRISEVRVLNVRDVISPGEKNELAALRVWGKGARERRVPIGADAYQAVREYLEERGALDRQAPLLVCRYRGQLRRMSRRGLQERFKQLARRAYLPPTRQHPHLMRHSAAMRWLWESEGMVGGVYSVAQLLGHSRVTTTEQYLSAPAVQLERAVMADPLVESSIEVE